MKFIDIGKQYKILKNEIDTSIHKVLDSGNFIQGTEVKELEDSLANYSNAKFCLTNANGTDALEIILKSLNLKEKDQVIVPSFTWVSSAEAPKYLGLDIVFCDVNPDTFNVCVDSFKKLINKKTKVLIAVSLFGQCSDLIELKKICKEKKIILIEDAAQSFGAMHMSKKSCSIADYSFTSFFPSKPLGCYGDGGAIFVNNKKNYEKIRLIAQHGQVSRDKFSLVGRNSRLDAIQAAILKVKLRHFDEEIHLRNEIFKIYANHIDAEQFQTPHIRKNNTSVFAIFTVKSTPLKILKAQAKLLANKIPCVRYYTKPIHMQAPYISGQSHSTNLPVTEKLSKSTLSLPMHPYISKSDVKKVAKIINSI